MSKHKCCCNDYFNYDYEWQKTNIYSKYYNSNNTEYVLDIEKDHSKTIDLTILLESDLIDSLYLASDTFGTTQFELVSNDSENKTSEWRATITPTKIASDNYDVILKLKSGCKILLYQGIINCAGVVETENVTYNHILTNSDEFEGVLTIVTNSQDTISTIGDVAELVKNKLVINMFYILNNTQRVINKVEYDDDNDTLVVGEFFDTSSMVYFELDYDVTLTDQTIIL